MQKIWNPLKAAETLLALLLMGVALPALAGTTPQTITFNDPGPQTYGTSPTLTATASSGLPVTFTSSSTAICTVTNGGTLTFVAAGTCSIAADQSGDSTYAAASTVMWSFSVSPVVPGAPVIGTATAGDASATVSFTAPASNGGTAITGYGVTANPGGSYGTCAASPCTVSGLTNGTTYTLTVTANNAAGTSAASAASNAVTPKGSQFITFNNPGAQNFGTIPTLTATASSGLAVRFTSSTTGVCTISSGGALTFVSAGTCTINADQAGNSSYTAAATVTQAFAVNAVVPGAPWIGTVTAGDTQATVSFTPPTSDGGASITGYTATSNPGGVSGTCAASPCTVSGLTDSIAYSFTVTATNSAGTGSASAASSSVTPAAAPTVTSVAVPANGTYTIGQSLDLTVNWDSAITVAGTPSIALVIGSTTVYASYISGSGTTATLFRYTIQANQNDTNGITVGALSLGGGTLRNSNGTDAGLTLNGVGSTAGVLVNTTPGAPTSVTATAGYAQATVTFAAPANNGGSTITGYTVTSIPAGGVDSNTGSTSLTHTLTGLVNGTSYTFTVTATSTSGTGAVSAASNAVTPTATPSATTATLQYGLNAPAVLDLAPFIHGTSVRITVPPAHGTASVNGTQVTYTPNHNFFGADSLTYVAVNTTGTSAPATVTVTFTGSRPNPTADTDVTGLAATQTQTAQRFSHTQIANFQDRFEALHQMTEMLDAPAGHLADANLARPAPRHWTGLTDLTAANPAFGNFSSLMAGSLQSLADSSAINLNLAMFTGDAPPAAAGLQQMNIWAAGTLRIGRASPTAGPGAAWTTDGVSLGTDRRLSNQLIVGMGLGYAHNTTMIGSDGSNNTSDGVSLVGYESWQYRPALFVDAMLGYGTLTFNTNRYVAAVTDFARASRPGHQLFGSATASGEYRRQHVLIAPYARYDFAIDQLDQATEAGAGNNALQYATETDRTQRLSLGLRAETRMTLTFGDMLPRARIEYQHHLETASQAQVAYADLPGTAYTMTLPADSAQSLLLGMGSGFLLRHHWNLDCNVEWVRSPGVVIDKALFLTVTKELWAK